MYSAGSNPFTSPAIRQLKPVESKAVIGAMLFTACRMAFQTHSVPIPTEVSNPTTVTTTLRDKWDSGKCPRLLLLGLDVVDGVLNGRDLFGVLVGNVQVERFLKRHHQFDDVERIGAQVIDKTRCGIDLRFIHAELLDDDLFDLLLYGHEPATFFRRPARTSPGRESASSALKLIDSTEPGVAIATTNLG